MAVVITVAGVAPPQVKAAEEEFVLDPPPGPFPPELSSRSREERLRPPRLRDPRASTPSAGRFSGPAFPFGSTPQAVFGVKDDVLVIATSIVNILSTPRGSVPYDPTLGSQVPYLLFEVLDDVTIMTIRQFAAKEISEQEPRVVVTSVETDVPLDGDALTVVISVGFRIVGDPLQRTYNVPVDLPRLAA